MGRSCRVRFEPAPATTVRRYTPPRRMRKRAITYFIDGRHRMPTHQSLSGASDEDLLQRMVKTHPERFGPEFWAFFAAHVGPGLPARPVMIDLGCGPGLFLRDLGERYPTAA